MEADQIAVILHEQLSGKTKDQSQLREEPGFSEQWDKVAAQVAASKQPESPAPKG